jgi:hypothetical protein
MHHAAKINNLTTVIKLSKTSINATKEYAMAPLNPWFK